MCLGRDTCISFTIFTDMRCLNSHNCVEFFDKLFSLVLFPFARWYLSQNSELVNFLIRNTFNSQIVVLRLLCCTRSVAWRSVMLMKISISSKSNMKLSIDVTVNFDQISWPITFYVSQYIKHLVSYVSVFVV